MWLVKMSTNSSRWAFNFTKWAPTESQILIATSCVQNEEKERLAKFVFKKDFKASLIGRLMMRKYVAETFNVAYKDVIFKRDDRGKPYLDNSIRKYPDLSFNVSHQGDYAVFAAEPSRRRLGVDVMKLDYAGGRNLSEFFRIMTRQFSPNEWKTIKGCDGEKKQIAMFCRHWALKESYVKAIGVGITVNLQDISFKINSMQLFKDLLVTDTELYLKGVKQDWVFEEMLLDDEHCVAVALEKDVSGGTRVLFEEIDFNTLMCNCESLLPTDEVYTRNFFIKM